MIGHTVYAYSILLFSLCLGTIVTAAVWLRGWIRIINFRAALCCCPVRREAVDEESAPAAERRQGGARGRGLAALGLQFDSGGVLGPVDSGVFPWT